MAKEIERKFIVTHIPGMLTGKVIRQGYILYLDDAHLRVRLIDDKGYLTLKFSQGIERDEYEYEIPFADAEEIFEKCLISLTKTRYSFELGECHVDIDDFGGGLLLGEIEMPSIDYEFEKPLCFGGEVTGIPQYTNIAIAASKH